MKRQLGVRAGKDEQSVANLGIDFWSGTRAIKRKANTIKAKRIVKAKKRKIVSMFENERRGQKGMEYPVLHLMQCITPKI